MKRDVYEEIPILENEQFLLREIHPQNDIEDLLKVYSDEKAVPLFNADNCHGENFHFKTKEEMKIAIDAWNYCYQQKDFVRWAIEDKYTNEAIGTIELFNRKAEDYFHNCGLLRLDLRSDYETQDGIEKILSIIISDVEKMFGCDKIATKAISMAVNRIHVLEKVGFLLSDEPLIGHDGRKYTSYYVMEV